MKKLLALSLVCCASPAAAASYSVALATGGPGTTSPISFSGFDGSLGTLTGVTFTLSGATTYNIALPFDGTTVPPSGTASYTLTNGAFLYVQPTTGTVPFNLQPYLQETGSGTVPIVQGVFEAATSGLNGVTEVGQSQLAAFVNTAFTGTLTVDPPFNSTLSVNENSTSLAGATIGVTAKSITGTVTYTYDALAADVPEPATWATTILGLGLVGAVGRGRRVRARLA